MADNDFEYRADDCAKRKARRERQRQQRRNRMLAEYKKRLAETRSDDGKDK